MAPASVLVIEDNLDNLELVSFLLERGGFHNHQSNRRPQRVGNRPHWPA